MTLEFLKTDPAADETIEVEAIINAPVARVWRAWTTASDLKRWFGRKAGSVASAEVDARTGGSWCFRFAENDEGDRLEGMYLDVTPEQRLVFTWRHIADDGKASPQSTVTVTFAPIGNKTALAIRHEGIQTLASRNNISHGWSDCVSNLQHHLV